MIEKNLYFDEFYTNSPKSVFNKHITRVNEYVTSNYDRLACLGRFESNIDLPRNMDLILRYRGSIGYDLTTNEWVVGHYSTQRDSLNNPKIYYAHSLDTSNRNVRELKPNVDVIVCDNTFLSMSDHPHILRSAQFTADTDVSMYYQLINSRNTPIVTGRKNTIRTAIKNAFEKLRVGEPVVLVTDLCEDVKRLDLTDPSSISKMECLTSFSEVLLKRISNLMGINLDVKDKGAQVNNAEILGYDDYTSANADCHIIPRLDFCDRMKTIANIEITYKVGNILKDNSQIEQTEDSEETVEETTEDSEEVDDNDTTD